MGAGPPYAMSQKLDCLVLSCRELIMLLRGSQRDVVYLGALVCEPKCREREGVAGSRPMSTAVHRSPNTLWRSSSIFNL